MYVYINLKRNKKKAHEPPKLSALDRARKFPRHSRALYIIMYVSSWHSLSFQILNLRILPLHLYLQNIFPNISLDNDSSQQTFACRTHTRTHTYANVYELRLCWNGFQYQNGFTCAEKFILRKCFDAIKSIFSWGKRRNQVHTVLSFD